MKFLCVLFCSLAVLLGGVGCDSGTSETSTTSQSEGQGSINVGGFYANPQGGSIVNNNPGAGMTSLRITQEGNQLTAVDNSGSVFRGALGAVHNNSANFELAGQFVGMVSVTIAGMFSVEGRRSSLRATWIGATQTGQLSAERVEESAPEPVQDTTTPAASANQKTGAQPAETTPVQAPVAQPVQQPAPAPVSSGGVWGGFDWQPGTGTLRVPNIPHASVAVFAGGINGPKIAHPGANGSRTYSVPVQNVSLYAAQIYDKGRSHAPPTTVILEVQFDPRSPASRPNRAILYVKAGRSIPAWAQGNLNLRERTRAEGPDDFNTYWAE